MAKPQMRSPSPGLTLGRASFSSIRERDADFTQTFTSSKVSSYSGRHNDEAAVVDEPLSPASAVFSVAQPPSPSPAPSPSPSQAADGTTAIIMRLPAVPGDEFEDQTGLVASSVARRDGFNRSLAWLDGDFQGFQDAFPRDALKQRQDSLLKLGRTQVDGSHANSDDADTAMQGVEDKTQDDAEDEGAALQPFEKLPIEVYRLIINHLMLETPPNGIDRRNVDLMSLLVVSRPLYGKTLEALYRRVTIPHSRIFQKFLSQIDSDPVRGTWVRRLDFSHFNPVSLFSTASEREAARNLTAETLLRCLDRMPNLQEFLAQDYLDSDISEGVLRKLLTGLPSLRALDLCGCSAAPFRNAFAALTSSSPSASAPAAAPWPNYLDIQRLSLHKCITLPSSVFEFVLPKLAHLTHLDVANTRITDAALHSIPHTARITHLNLAKCSLLTADGVIDFLANHPAVNRNSLVFLSLGFDAATSQLLDAEAVTRLLPTLPASLKSLSLKGSKMDRSHVPRLRVLSKHLEELALGRCLDVGDVNALVVPPKHVSAAADSTSTEAGNNNNNKADWIPHTLRYLDLTDMNADTLDLSSLYLDSRFLDPITAPLEVIEVSDDVFKRVSKSKGPLTRMGWRQSEIGSRSWLVRGSHPAGQGVTSISGSFAMENGQRPWKMGAQSWGMRKIPVAHAKVGGMYGSYMFGRKL
ncbi:leucine rich repeat domain containing protein [Niveomyces insectorum RCEF 264]|uniref:Leucine rich repeat domain containing protein n=1 Tax=Niveomyces insectorum RCEF 264 TaxID=1081102 RepID=A0A167Z5Y0_9HYPO|nr:leucine rich repeat domain containing protein [Niveomyces insectorum RCEF 264]